MRISRIGIINFANFANLDVRTGDNIVVVGENKVGKSNFIRALQLILDPGMSERDRHLGLDDFWDGLRERKLGASIEIFVEFTDFTNNPRLMAHLADCVTEAGPPMVARLTYRFQPKANLEGPPESLADYEDISPARAPDVRGWTVVSRRSSELVPQFEGEGHGNQLSVAVPHQLCAGRVALASEPPAEAPDQTDSVAEARRRRQLA